MSKKIIIIGAGPGGLSAAMLLAHKGYDVHVFEKEAEVGGRNAPLHLGKYTFDTGPTFLMMDFILRKVFKESGKKIEDYLTLFPLNDPMYSLIFKNFKLDMTRDHKEMEARIEKVFPGSGPGFQKFLKREATRYQNLYPCLEKPYNSALDLLSFKILKAVPHISATRSMFQVLGDYFKDDDLKIAFTFQAKYLGMSAWQCPGLFTMIPYVEHRLGIYHVEGGLNQISLAMKKAAEEEGATFHLSTPIKHLLQEGKHLKGVELKNGTKVEADAVFINADFAYAAKNLFEKPLKKYSPKKIDSMKFSCSTWMLYLGLDKLYDLPHHSIYFADDYKENIKDIFENGLQSEDFSFYIQNASITDKTVAPEGHSTMYLLVPTTNNRGTVNWSEQSQKMREKILKFLEEKVGLKDIRQHIRAERIINPEHWQSDFNVHEGATFNLSHGMDQLLHNRPRNKFEEFDNCYLVGGGTHPGSGLPTIYESARISVGMLDKEFSS